MITNQTVIQKYQGGKSLDLLFFWGHTNSNPNIINQTCFSQWYISSFKFEDVHYSTAEQFMMAKKAQLFNDVDSFNQIINTTNPKEAKSIGRKVKNFDENTWLSQRLNIVHTANYEKFRQNEDLKEYIINTGDAILVEASPVDSIWGIGMAVDNPKIHNPTQWKGENLLGYILMDVRDKLKIEDIT